jgi:DedD protein
MLKETAGEQELNLKKRARRRLVGAIALVLLMMIILPMILKDRAVNNNTDDVVITLSNEPTESSASDFDSSIVPNKVVQELPEIAPKTETATADVEDKSVVDLPEATKKTEKDTEASVAEVEKKTAPTITKEAPKDAPITQKQAEVAQTEPTKPAPLKLKFYVQVGVFSDANNVKQLQSKLTDLGYQSKTETTSTDKGPKIRLKTQTFSDRNEASIALQNIKDAGLPGMVVSQ